LVDQSKGKVGAIRGYEKERRKKMRQETSTVKEGYCAEGENKFFTKYIRVRKGKGTGGPGEEKIEREGKDERSRNPERFRRGGG